MTPATSDAHSQSPELCVRTRWPHGLRPHVRKSMSAPSNGTAQDTTRTTPRPEQNLPIQENRRDCVRSPRSDYKIRPRRHVLRQAQDERFDGLRMTAPTARGEVVEPRAFVVSVCRYVVAAWLVPRMARFTRLRINGIL